MPLAVTDSQSTPQESLGLSPPGAAWSVGPYECSMSSSDIDLTLRDDLTASVQDYLMRVVDELHQLSRWAAECQSRVQQCEIERDAAIERERERERDAERQRAAAVAPMQQATLLVQTEVELLRRDIHLASQEVFQRCTSQMGYVQHSFRSEYDDQLADMQKRLDDKLRTFTHKTGSIVETAQTEADVRMRALELSARQLQTQVEAEQGKIDALETTVSTSLQSLSTSLFKQQTELHQTQRRTGHFETSLAQQWKDVRAIASELRQNLRAAQAQLSSKVQVIRQELQDTSEDLNRKFLQANKVLGRVVHNAVVGGTSSQAESVGLASTIGAVNMHVGAQALTTTRDCFLHAKAALPHRECSEASASVRKPYNHSGTAIGSTSPTETLDTTSKSVRPPAERVNGALQIQPSTLSQPVGRDDVGEPGVVSDGGLRMSRAIHDWTVSTRPTSSAASPTGTIAAKSSPRRMSARLQLGVGTGQPQSVTSLVNPPNPHRPDTAKY